MTKTKPNNAQPEKQNTQITQDKNTQSTDKNVIYNVVIEKMQKQINDKIVQYKQKLQKTCDDEVNNIVKSLQIKIDEQRKLLDTQCDKEITEAFNKKQSEYEREWEQRSTTLKKQHASDPTKAVFAGSKDIAQKKQEELEKFKIAKQEHYNGLLQKFTANINKEKDNLISNYVDEQNKKLDAKQNKIIKDLKQQLDTWSKLPQEVLQTADQKFFEKEAEVFLQGIVDVELSV